LSSRPLKNLNASGSAVKADGHRFAFNNNGNLAFAFGMLQHFLELLWIRYNVEIFNLFFAFGISCTSCPRVGSGIFSEYQYFFRHGLLLLPLWDFNYLFYFYFNKLY